MKELISHIEYLLIRHDCVVLPGLGAFIVTYPSNANYSSSQIIKRPQRRIRFNRNIINDDGLLINSYARKQKINFEEARELVKFDIFKLRKAINLSGKIKIGRLGEILIDSEGNYIFNSSSDFIDCKILFPDITLFSSKNNHRKEIPYKIDLKKSTPKIYQFSSWVACIAILISISLLIISPLAYEEKPEMTSILPLEWVKLENRIKVKEKIAAEKELKKTTYVLDQNESKEYGSNKYHLIIAAFKSDKEAEDFIVSAGKDNSLKKISSKKFINISIESSDDRQELQRLLNSKEIQQKYPQSWIYEN